MSRPRVPFSYLERQFADPEEYLDDIRALVKAGNFTLGEPVQRFEQNFAALSKMPYAVGVGSGTDALLISLTILGIGPGDEVITTANQFIAPAGAIACAGARPVFVDSDDAYMMDVARIEAAITPRTRAIIAVHHNGNVCDMPSIMKIAAGHNLLVIEDACHAIGASLDGQPVGSWGETACFSLHPLKNLNVWGDGGVIVTRSQELCEKLRLYRNHGLQTRDEVVLFGRNSRLHTVQAAIGNRLIGHADFITDRRIAIGRRYDEMFADFGDEVRVPSRRANVKHVFFQYIIRAKRRDELLRFLHDAGVEAKIHYPIPIHLQGGARHLGYKAGDLPVTENDSRTILSLPLHQHLTDEEVDYVVERVRSFCTTASASRLSSPAERQPGEAPRSVATVVPQKMSVPLIDIMLRAPALKEALLQATDRVLSHGQLILGREVESFEAEFAAYVGTTFAVGVGNGTDALTLTMKGLGIGPGDEVITAANSFLASASAVIFAGARPVLVDMCDDATLDPARVAAAVTPRTKAIIPVHLMGQPADMQAVLDIAQTHGLHVIEDAAQAAGARIGNTRVGSFGTAGAFSFHPLKTLSACGDAGMVTTNDRKLYEYLRLARTHGLKDRDDCAFWSINSRLDALQAAYLSVKLRYLDAWNATRRAHAAFYRDALAGLVDMPVDHADRHAVYYMFVIQTDRRDDLQEFLQERGVGSAVHYPTPIHLKRAAKALGYQKGDFPAAERWSDRILSIPATQEHTPEQCAYVAECIREFVSTRQ